MDTQHWVVIGPDGSEQPAAGPVWTAAPRHRGGDSLWVHDGTSLVRIGCAARAHHVGIEDADTGRWLPKGGRMVTRGEWYSESDPRSRMASDTQAHARTARAAWRRARSRAVSPFDEEAWINVVNALTMEESAR